jgi:hypothetical protein
MKLRRVLLQMSLLTAGTIPLANAAPTYKWVDERGVVNYGNNPPAAARQVRQLDEEAGRVSTVPAVPRAQLERENEHLLRARVARLEEEVDELRRARVAAPVVAPAFDPYFAFPPPVAVVAPALNVPLHRLRPRTVHRPLHPPLRGGASVRLTTIRR